MCSKINYLKQDLNCSDILRILVMYMFYQRVLLFLLIATYWKSAMHYASLVVINLSYLFVCLDRGIFTYGETTSIEETDLWALFLWALGLS